MAEEKEENLYFHSCIDDCINPGTEVDSGQRVSEIETKMVTRKWNSERGQASRDSLFRDPKRLSSLLFDIDRWS